VHGGEIRLEAERGGAARWAMLLPALSEPPI